MTKCKAILCAILMGITFSIFSPLCVSAQEKESEKPLRPVTSVFTVELGRQSALDTYLTPIRYWGLDVALGYERLRAVNVIFFPLRLISKESFLFALWIKSGNEISA